MERGAWNSRHFEHAWSGILARTNYDEAGVAKRDGGSAAFSRSEQAMARISPLTDAQAPPNSPAGRALDAIRSPGGRVTNMKRTLAREPVALRALLSWYDLRDVVQPFLGDRLTTLFAHAISTSTDCLVCSTFFRRILVEAGEDPDSLHLDEWERTVVEYGRQLALDPHGVSDSLFSRLAARLEADQIVALTAFGGLMVATNLFNNALQVDLDEYLLSSRKGGRL
jgi:alkylhydroperoxidase family enzyme